MADTATSWGIALPHDDFRRRLWDLALRTNEVVRARWRAPVRIESTALPRHLALRSEFMESAAMRRESFRL